MFEENLNVLSRCAGQLFRVSRAQVCFGFKVLDEGASYTCDFDTQVEHSVNDLPRGLIEDVAALQREVAGQGFNSHDDILIFAGQENPFGIQLRGHFIQNVRVVPIGDPVAVYAIMFLVNVANDKMEATRNSLKPFVTATANLFSIKQIRNFLPEQRASLSTQSRTGVSDLLSHVYHPVIMFNQRLEITKYNKHSMAMIQQSTMDKSQDLRNLLAYFVPNISKEIITAVENFEFNAKLHQGEWKNVPFKLNAFQSIQVDLAVVVITPNDGKAAYKATANVQNFSQFALIINDNKRNELHSLQRFQALTSLIPLGILQLSADFKCIYANDTWSKITSLTSSTSLQDGWTKCFASRDLHRILPQMAHLNLQNREYTEELEITSHLKEDKWISIKSVGLFDLQGKIEGYILTIDDISQAYAHKQALESLANTDSLTGISNRSNFHDRLRVAISRVERHDNAAVLFLDLDKFKAINDIYGHNAGDVVIQKVAQRLNNIVRNEDTIARLGGDEFAVIISDVRSDADMVNLAVKIIIEIAKPMQIEKNSLKVECSIGVAPIKNSRTNIKTVLKHADLAVYKAKSLGRNQFCMYTESLERETLLANYLRASLKDSKATGFFMEYQPQVDSTTNEIVGIEVLSRWQHPSDEQVSPQEFILQLETHGLINDFFVWQLSSMLPLAKNWVDIGLISATRRLSLNVSAVQLHLPNLSKQILEAFKQHNVDPSCFGLEVTETAFMQDPLGAGNNLKLLREAGFTIALDDFGTGFSSLSLLRNMPLDAIKIDKEFIAEILINPTDAKIVQSMIMLSRELDLDVVAEGVESAEVKDWLEAHNCNLQQGFHFYKPMASHLIESCINDLSTLH